MTRLILAASAVLAGALGMGALATPAMAQGADGTKVNMVIVYGDDKCPENNDKEIVVCARKDESERYRIPEPFRDSTSPQNQAWTERVKSYEMVGAAGTMSCSPVGAGGWTGCANQFIQKAYAEKKAGTDVAFSKMIAEARALRESTIDADAAKTQADVEKEEKAYDERQRARAEAEEKAKEEGTSPAPAATPTPAAGK
jgi:hypothetical protein